MRVHVWGADGDVAPDELGRVHVGIAEAVVAPVHPQHRLLHLRAPDDATAANTERMLRGRVHLVIEEEGVLFDHVLPHHRRLHLRVLDILFFGEIAKENCGKPSSIFCTKPTNLALTKFSNAVGMRKLLLPYEIRKE